MNAQTIDWNDIPFALAVCETGSLSAAARALKVNHSTVFRRIEGIEQKLGVTLFERLSHGYIMTAAGENFLSEAKLLKEGVTRIQRELGGQDSRLEGKLTITTTDSLLHYFRFYFAEFQEMYPDVELRLLSGTLHLDLMQKDADIALRPTQAPPEHWVGKKLFPISYSAYAHTDYAEKLKNLSPSKHRWIQLIDELHHSPMNRLSKKLKDIEAPITVSSSLLGMLDLAGTGLGIAVLPCYVITKNTMLIKIYESEKEINSDLWMLAHPDMRRSAKVHAFFEFVTRKMKKSESNSAL